MFGHKTTRDEQALIANIFTLQSRVEELVQSIRLELLEDNVRRSPEEMKSLLHGILRFRERRKTIFGGSFFGEPAWDVLLEIYYAEIKGRKESISSLCLASGSPPTTALRYIRTLEKEGWIRRSADQHDKRRFYLHLTDKGKDAMDKLFAGTRLREDH